MAVTLVRHFLGGRVIAGKDFRKVLRHLTALRLTTCLHIWGLLLEYKRRGVVCIWDGVNG